MDEIDPEIEEIIDKKIEIITLARQIQALHDAFKLLGLDTYPEVVDVPEDLKKYVENDE